MSFIFAPCLETEMLNRGNFSDLLSQHFTGSRSFYLNSRILLALPLLVGSHRRRLTSFLSAGCEYLQSLGSGTWSGLFSALKPHVRDPRLWSQAGLKGNGQFRPYPGKEGAKAHMGVVWPATRGQGFLRPRESH